MKQAMNYPIRLGLVFICLTLLTVILSCNVSVAQRIIHNPSVGGTNSPYIKILSVELTDTATIMKFRTTYFPNMWIKVSTHDTHILTSEGGEMLFVKAAEGIELNQEHYTPESGINEYTLFFPPLDSSVKRIDYLESQWKIYDIYISDDSDLQTIPDWLAGNWLKTDGSNDWMFGFFKDVTIYNELFWEKAQVSQSEKGYQLSIKKNNETKVFLANPSGDNKLRIGPVNGDPFLLAREKSSAGVTGKTEFNRVNFDFTKQISNYQGYIDGYHPKMGKTVVLEYFDPLANNYGKTLVEINPNGTFIASIPLYSPQKVMISLLNTHHAVFLEPGKSLLHYINLEEFTNQFLDYKSYQQREKKSLFMGNLAATNHFINEVPLGIRFDYDDLMSKIQEMDLNQFIQYHVELLNQQIDALKEYSISKRVGPEFYDLLLAEQYLETINNILNYSWLKASRPAELSDQLPDNNTKKEHIKKGDLDFAKAIDFENLRLLSTGYSLAMFTHNLSANDMILANLEDKNLYTYMYLLDELSNDQIRPSADEMVIINLLMNCLDYSCISNTIQQDQVFFTNFYTRYKSTFERAVLKYKNSILLTTIQPLISELLSTKGDLLMDIMLFQNNYSMINTRLKGLSEAEKIQLSGKFKNNLIAGHFFEISKKLDEQIAEQAKMNLPQIGFSINQTPDGKGEELFGNLMEKYKGKLIYVDFWATWCGPCLRGIETIKPLKEELDNEDIIFVYITNTSSPENTWEEAISKIKGEHYRLSEDEWNYFSYMFNISGIPHYLLLDRNGNVIQNKLWVTNDQLKALLLKHY